MKILIAGGCKTGKTGIAQERVETLAPKGKRVYYATMIPADEEDEARIARHRKEREGKGYVTVEWGNAAPEPVEGSAVLVDSITAMLQNLMFSETPTYSVNPDAVSQVLTELDSIAEQAKHIIFVSDILHSDAILYDKSTEAFRRALGEINRHLAAECDEIIEVTAGRQIRHFFDKMNTENE